MVYRTFQTKIINDLQSCLGGNYHITLEKIPKNNGTVLDSICITRDGQRSSPAICLNSYYERYLEGNPVHAIVSEILRTYEDHSRVVNLDFSIFNDFSRLKEKVVYKLIHTASNRELLRTIPSVPYLDLSIVFYIYLERNTSDQITVLIRNNLMETWNTDLNELYELALVNTPKLLPARLHSMAETMQYIVTEQSGIHCDTDFLKQILSPSAALSLYVLTNAAGYLGACTILYPGQLKNFADQAGTDLIILPSSIHEVLLIPHDYTFSFQELNQIVSHINRTEVSPEDRLSDQVYLYSRTLDQVTPAGRPVTSLLS